MTNYQSHAHVFRALGDENRLRILEMLRQGEKCACMLIDQLQMGQSALSYHMKILVESGIVESWQVGKWTHYKLSEKGGERACQLLKELTTPDASKQTDTCC